VHDGAVSESAHPPPTHQPGYGGDPRWYPAPPYAAAPTQLAPPPANAGWAVAALLFFWPLAFSAFNHAFAVHPLWAAGDLQGAHYASGRVKQLGKYALWIFFGAFALFVVLYVVLIAVIISSIPQYPG
jgi:hypothetical protein